MSIGENLKKERKRQRLTVAEIAAQLCISRTAIYDIENGKTKESAHFEQYAALLGKPLSYFDPEGANVATIKHNSMEPFFIGEKDLKVYASAMAGDGTLIVDTNPIDYIGRPESLRNEPDGYGLMVTGDSMSPRFESGEVVYVHPRMSLSNNCDVVLYSENAAGEVFAMVKRLLRYNETTWFVKQLNPEREFELARSKWQKCHLIVGAHYL